MRQLRIWKRLWRRSLTRSHKRTSMGPSRSYWNGTSALQPKEITSKRSRSFMCVLSIKVPIWKKSVNLFNDPRVYIYIYIYIIKHTNRYALSSPPSTHLLSLTNAPSLVQKLSLSLSLSLSCQCSLSLTYYLSIYLSIRHTHIYIYLYTSTHLFILLLLFKDLTFDISCSHRQLSKRVKYIKRLNKSTTEKLK